MRAVQRLSQGDQPLHPERVPRLGTGLGIMDQHRIAGAGELGYQVNRAAAIGAEISAGR